MNHTLRLFFLIALLCNAQCYAEVIFDWAYIGNPGNEPEVYGDGFLDTYSVGRVDYECVISKHEVTNSQYAEFLNAVDPLGANELNLYYHEMAGNFGGIEKSGINDGARYVAQQGRQQNPVNFISYTDAMRFINWMHNGQGAGDTEVGVYQVSGQLNPPRSSNAKYWIPSEDEWYKSAYYDPINEVYYDYPTGTDNPPYSDNPNSLDTPDNTNVANYVRIGGAAGNYDNGYAISGREFPDDINPFTDVGAYTLATSPYGTFDQAGNVSEWNEEFFDSLETRGLRGGAWNSRGNLRESLSMASFSRGYAIGVIEDGSTMPFGFRVAGTASLIPEPNSALIALIGSISLLIRRRDCFTLHDQKRTSTCHHSGRNR